MVSYFVPRGRFLIKAANLRQAATTAAHQKHNNAQQQQQQQGKWPMLRQLRQNFSTARSNGVTGADAKQQTTANNNSSTTTLMRTNFKNRSTQRKCMHTDTTSRSQQQQQQQAAEQCKQQQQQQGGDNTRRSSFWFKWTGFLLRWAPIGICVFGAIEWQVHKEKCKRKLMPPTASEFQSKVYCSLPLRIMSRAWGWLAACQMPVALRPYVYGWYSNTFNVNIEEALYPDFKHYNSISEFFTRPLREGVRTIDAKAPVVSPADGKVLHFGKATDSLIEQVKGVNYSIEAFLGPPANHHADPATLPFAEAIKEKRDGSTTLYQCVIYLAPGDYHRFHSPAEWQPILRRHFSGELLSVSPKIATWLPGLFCLNERALYMGKWEHGFFSYTAVGATNVGSVQIFMDEELKTNRWTGWHVGAHKKGEEFSELVLGKDVKLKKGELVGQFNMGSTIVLLFEAPVNFKFTIEAGQKIRVGEPMGYLAED